MNKQALRLFFTLCTLALMSFSLHAEDRIELKGTSIIGNKELPKMLYIVPWKSAELPNMDAPPIESLIDDALSTVDRDRFKLKIHYYKLYSSQKKKQSENQ